MGIWSERRRTKEAREAGRGLAFRDDREDDGVVPRRRSLASGGADGGVSTVAFKLTKSKISQIRLWLFLREPARRVMDKGAAKND